MNSPIEHDKCEFFLGKFGPITGYGIAMMAAFGVAHWVSQMVLEERGDDVEIMNDVTFAALIGTIIGGKVTTARRMAEVLDDVGTQVMADVVGLPGGLVEEALGAVRIGLPIASASCQPFLC